MQRFAWIGNVIGGLWNHGKWALGGLLGAEVLTDKGKGGVVTRGVREAGDSVITEQSALQARNALWDATANSSAGVNAFLGGALKVICDFLANCGLDAAKGWSQGLENFRQQQEREIQELRARSRDGAGQEGGILSGDTLTTGLGLGAAYLGFNAIKNTFSGGAGSTAGLRLGGTAANFLAKIPVVGRFLAPAALAGGALVASMWPSDANAAEGTQPAETETHSMAATVGGLGASIIAATPAVSAIAVPTASLGLKAIPGIASIVAAGEGIFDTVAYALDGQWAQAGTRLVAGVGETVAGLGGILTYGTVGTAWREAVRAGGAAIFGEEKAIEHSHLYNAGSWLISQFTNAHDNTAPAPEERTADYTVAPTLVPAMY